MNKTISINIAGYVFNIEEQAYEKLSQYLNSIKANFKNEADCEEIMTDIESRIAELFQENLSDRKEVIVETDVEEVISIMGKPEDYVSEETADNFNNSDSADDAEYVEAEEVKGSGSSSSKSRPRPSTIGGKRLYRDEKNGTVGGVCTGLGWFFGIDPVLIKIAFILMTVLGGSGMLIYIILWIVIPEAKTTAEILEMQGEPVNLGSIKDHVKGTKDDIKSGAQKGKKNVKRAVDKGVSAGSKLADSLTKILGGIFILGGIGALFVLFIILFGHTGLLPLVGDEQIEDLATMLNVVYPTGRGALVFISILVVALIPILAGIFLGTKLLFDIKGKFKRVSLIVTILWFLAVGSLVLTGIELGMNFRNHAEIDYDVPVKVDSTDILYVDVKEDDVFSNFIEYQQVWNYSELIKLNNDKIYLGYPQLKIVEKADSGSFDVILYKESHGRYHKEAIHKAESIEYDIKSKRNQLDLAPYFIIDEDAKMRGQKVTVEIHVPIGKKVKFGPNVDRIMVGVADAYYDDSGSFANTVWVAEGEGGFSCTGCDERRIYDNDLIEINIDD